MPAGAFETILEYAARSFKLHGFKDIVFLGDHGGYQANEKTVANKLNREWASTNVRAHAVTQYYDAAQIDFARILKDKGFTLPEIGTHAGLNDTSLMLALDPSLVRQDRLVPGIETWERRRRLWGSVPGKRNAWNIGRRCDRFSNGRRHKVRCVTTMTRSPPFL